MKSGNHRVLWNILFLLYPLTALLLLYLFSPDTETIRKTSQPVWILGLGMAVLSAIWLIWALMFLSSKHTPLWIVRILTVLISAGLPVLWYFVAKGSLNDQKWLTGMIEYKVYFRDLLCFGALSFGVLTQTAALVFISSAAGRMKRKISRLAQNGEIQKKSSFDPLNPKDADIAKSPEEMMSSD